MPSARRKKVKGKDHECSLRRLVLVCFGVDADGPSCMVYAISYSEVEWTLGSHSFVRDWLST